MDVKSDGWVPARDVRNYADGQLTVTITLSEYRDLVAYRAAMEERQETMDERQETMDEEEDD